jgi:hypothetical protein
MLCDVNEEDEEGEKEAAAAANTGDDFVMWCF